MNILSLDDVIQQKKSVKNPHVPGEVHVMSDGTEYTVQSNGSWKKTKLGIQRQKMADRLQKYKAQNRV